MVLPLVRTPLPAQAPDVPAHLARRPRSVLWAVPAFEILKENSKPRAFRAFLATLGFLGGLSTLIGYVKYIK